MKGAVFPRAVSSAGCGVRGCAVCGVRKVTACVGLAAVGGQIRDSEVEVEDEDEDEGRF